MAQLGFDVTKVAPRQARDIMPAGNYLAQATASEVGLSGSKQATIVKFELTILAPEEFKGRKVFDNINVSHQTSAEATRIGQETLSQFCHAANVPATDTTQLHNIPVCIRLSIEPPVLNADNSEKYAAKNIVRDYKPAGKYEPTTAIAAAAFGGDATQGFNQGFAAQTAQISGTAHTATAFYTPPPAAPAFAPAPVAAAPAFAPPPPAQAAPVAPPAAPTIGSVSPDGLWRLESTGWVSNVPAPAPAFAPPPPAAAAAGPWAPSAAAPAGAPAGPWTQG